jgi:ABC-type siderophore export system fused ATPase/permease subunit
MNIASRVIIGLLVVLLVLTIIYARVQRTKAYANRIMAEEFRETADSLRQQTQQFKEMAEVSRREAEQSRMLAEQSMADCVKQLAELKRTRR